MKVKLYLTTLLLVLLSLTAMAQQEVRFGQHRYTPPANTDALYGGAKRGSGPQALNQQLLVQFRKLPTVSERKQLANNGIVLGEYYGSNTFMATINAQKVQRSSRSRNIVAAFEMQSEWKVSSLIANNRVPEYAKVGMDELLVKVHYAPSMSEADVRAKLAELGLKCQHIAAQFGIVYMQLRKEAVNQLAQQNWVSSIGLQAAPEDLYNRGGRSLIKADVLGLPTELRGRGLTGKGVKVGIWDSNVEKHADYGKRLHQQEFESTVISSGGHGMHVAGTVAGAGLLDPTAMGMAPEADIYTYNFNVQSNNKRAYQEMLEAYQQFGISITQNSYGIHLSNVCDFVDQLSYNSTSDALALDNLVSKNPTLLLVFAAGNDQGACGLDYLSSTNRQKNVLHVGAVNEQGNMSSFSSWGPMDDGRLLPTVCAKGVDVWSTLPGDSYGPMDGTSMACPGASGLMALLVERYRQISGGQEPLAALLKAVSANAADDYGRPGPDYQYGFGVLNGNRAAETMEKGWYRIGSIGQGDADVQYNIHVPAGSKQLRVMLAWTDTVGKPFYDYGEPALINDLDLTVNGLQPWILDKDNPTAVAVRGRDTINNMEQVTIDNPSGDYTINVKASAVVSDKQQFVVAYYIERGDLEMVSPAGGELYAPGESITVRWYNAGAPLSFEISYDGGQTYEYLGALSQPKYSVSLSLPADAPATNKAMIRVSSNGRRATSGMFTIMGVPEVQLATDACNLSAWKLDWTPVAGATEYEVLKANEAEGTYAVIATVSDTTHTLVNEQISIDNRNIYAVRAKAGEVVGRRSLGQLAPNTPSQPITNAQLPFVEDFKIYPSRYFSTQVSPELLLTYAETSTLGIVDPDNLDSHVLYLKLKGGYSGSGQMLMSMCGLDLSGVSDTSKVMLSYKVVGTYGSDPSENISALRVNGGEWMENMSGVTYNVPLSVDENEWRTVAYDLSSYIGDTISLDMLFQLKGSAAKLIISEIRIEEIPETIDVQMLDIQTVASGNNLTESEVSVVIVNNSAKKIGNFPVQFAVNGGEPVREIVTDSIAPYAQYVYTFTAKANLRTNNELGEKFAISAKVLHESDVDMTNNWFSTEVHNFANLYTMPYSAWEVDENTNKKVFNDPKIEKVVDGSLVFTDHMGATGNYQDMGLTTIHFTPATPGKTLQITFRQIDLEDDYDFLFIYTDVDGIATLLDDNDPEMAAEITGVKEGVVFISGATDGGISVSFYSDDMTNATGWIADIQEIDRTNLFSISMEPLEGYRADGQFDINVKVKNHTPVAANSVNLALMVDGELVAEETIAQIAANAEVSHTFEAKADLSAIAYHDVEVRIMNSDADRSDNRVVQRKLNDRYCEIDSIAPQNAMYVALVAIEQGEVYKTEASEGYVDYRTTDTLTIYAQSASVMPLYVGVMDEQAGSRLGVAVDWNDDGIFELVAVEDLVAGQGIYMLSLDNGIEVGSHRMRIGVMDSALLEVCATGIIPFGDVKDFTLNVIDGEFPLHNDLEVAQISDLSGTNLTAAEELQVKITNNSCNVATGFQISYTLNDGEPVTETANISIAPFATEQYTFSTKLDLSAVGVHTIKVSLADDQVLANNVDSIEIINFVPEVDGFYALNVGYDEEVELGTVGGLSFSSGGTLEALINTQGGSLNTIYEGKEIWLLTTNGDAASWLPENSLVMLIGGGSGIYYTDANIIKPGTWQHIAVTLSPGWLYGVTVKMYIDGQEVNVTKDDEYLFRVDDGSSDPLYLASNLNGMVKSARLWNVARSQSDIQSNMYESVRNATGDLPTGCFAEYMFSEGPGNVITMSGNLMATISSNRTAAGANCIWVDPTDMLSTMYLAEQTEPAMRLVADLFGVLVNPGVDVSALEGKAVKAWPMATITLNGNDATVTQPFDFSSRKIQLDAQMTLMGRNVNRNYTVVVAHDASPAAELLSLTALAASNTGLTADVQVAPISATNSVMLPGVTDLSAVKFVFVVTDTATLHYNGQQYSNANNEVVFDLSEPAIFTVRSADGKHSNRYELTAFSNDNSINFSLASNAFTYGDAPVAVEAQATSGLPVEFASTDNRVATVVNGQLHIVGAGAVTITAYQDGGNGYGPAAEVAQSLTVAPKAVSINPVEQNIAYGDEIPALQFEYDGLVQPQHVLDLQLPNYSLFTANNVAYNQTDSIYIPVGVYTWKPAQANLGQQGSYMLTANNGTLTVEPAEAHNVIFSVTNGTNPIAGASIMLEALTVDYPVVYTTGADGLVRLQLIDNIYAYEASLAGYNQQSDIFVINGDDTTINIVLKQLTHTLTYNAASNGMIYGPKVQKVADGDNGQPVTAVAEAGYHFEKWNDGRVDNPRIDTDVKADSTVVAQFAINTFTLRYGATAGGSISSGDVEQQVYFGEDGTPVTAEANEGYMFVRWSDGRTDNPRTDLNVQNDIDVEAIFVYGRVPMFDLPYAQDFDGGIMPEGWATEDKLPTGSYGNWFITNESVNSLIRLNNYFAAAETYSAPLSGPNSSDVLMLSPWLNIDMVNSTEAIEISFNYMFRTYGDGVFVIAYRTADDADWTELYAVNSSVFSVTPAALTIAKSDIASASKLQLCWRYTATWDHTVLVDDILVTPSNPPATYNLTYLGGENGGQVSDGTTTAAKLEFTPNIGENGPQITAVPADGFEFVRWSDGVPTINRQDNVAAYVWPIYRKAAASVSNYTLAYTAGEHGRIEGQFYQLVVEGGNGSPVKAEPNEGYRFSGWSDGLAQNPRFEANVQSDVAVMALFERAEFSLIYTSAEGGKLSGDSTQVVAVGEIGKPVEAIANEGFHFVRWSDGRTDNPRIDTAGVADLMVEALFGHALTIMVVDVNAKPLAGVKVTLDGKTIITGADGCIADTLLPVKYAYSVELDGYDTKSGEVNLTEDMLLKIVLNKKASTGLLENITESLSIYPNPTSNGFYVKGAEGVVRIYDITGHLVLQQAINSQTRVDISHLPVGVYTVHVGNAVGRVVKQ